MANYTNTGNKMTSLEARKSAIQKLFSATKDCLTAMETFQGDRRDFANKVACLPDVCMALLGSYQPDNFHMYQTAFDECESLGLFKKRAHLNVRRMKIRWTSVRVSRPYSILGSEVSNLIQFSKNFCFQSVI